MNPDQSKAEPKLRILNFKGTGEHDAKTLRTPSGTHVPQASSINERVSYTISYPSVDVDISDIKPGLFEKSFPKVAEKATLDHLKSLKAKQ